MNTPVTVLLPCFNEEASVVGVVDGVAQSLAAAGQPFEIIVVDDGSSDASAQRLASCAVPVRVIRHRANRGYGASLKEGLRAASHETVIIMDADGQHRPETVLELLANAEGWDMVVGARRNQASHHWRMPGKVVLKWLCEFLAGTRIPDINSGLRVIRRDVARQYMHLCSDGFSFSTSITLALLSDRLSVNFVPIEVRSRQGGQSRVRVATGFATFMLILRIIGTFNPLRIFMPPTLLMFAIGLAYMLWGLVFRGNVGDLAVLLMVLSVLLFCFGLLADQVSLLRREISKSRS